MDNQEDEEERSRESTDEELYDPYSHRVTHKPLSDFGSLANMVKSAAGTGLFAMPSAFACVGLFFGIVGTALMGLMITGCLQWFFKIHHSMCARLRKPVLLYNEVVVATLAASARKPLFSPLASTLIVDVVMLMCYIGIGSVYIVFIADTVQECIDSERAVGQSYYALVILPFLFLMTAAKNLSDITPISVAGNILILAAGTIGIVYALKDGIGDTWNTIGPNANLYPKFIGMMFFSMSSPGVILAIEHSMERPWNYTKLCGVLNWGMGFLVLIHIFVGVIGYLKWGSESLDNFIRNHPENDGPTIVALMMQVLAMYFTYGLQCYVPITILKNNYVMPAIERGVLKGSPFLWDLIIRFLVISVMCVLAAAMPKLDVLTGLAGAICISTLVTLIPVTLYILVHYENFGKYKWRLVLGFVMFFVAFVGAVYVVTSSLIRIARFIKRK